MMDKQMDVQALISRILLLLSISRGCVAEECCLPSQFQASVGAYGGTMSGGALGVYDTDFRVAYDYPNRRWGYWQRFTYVTNEYTEWIYIEDFKARERKFVSAKGNYIMPMPANWIDLRDYCVPEDAATKDPPHRVGFGEEAVSVSSYEYTIASPGNNTDIFQSSFMPGCLPLSQVAWFQSNSYNYTSYLTFYDLEDHLDSWNPFDQHEKYYRGRSVHLDNWPKISEDAQRPEHQAEAFHLIRRLRVVEGDDMEHEAEEDELE